MHTRTAQTHQTLAGIYNTPSFSPQSEVITQITRLRVEAARTVIGYSAFINRGILNSSELKRPGNPSLEVRCH